jgi:ribosomal protein L11 methyltransferase
MHTIKIIFNNISEDNQDILVAKLSEIGYEGFEQTATSLLAYINEDNYKEYELLEVIKEQPYNIEIVPKQNWNQLWESNFEPVVIDGFCTIRADFHTLLVTTPYEIIITPKMSFGTGHHATTQLMMMMMKDIEFTGKQVLDFGTGTGVLAILAEKLGAYYVLAIDNDEWSVENTNENLERNNCSKVTALLETDGHIPVLIQDIILANINRHILLQYMDELYKNTKKGGIVLMSGLLTQDREVIVDAAIKTGFNRTCYQELNDWIALSFTK